MAKTLQPLFRRLPHPGPAHQSADPRNGLVDASQLPYRALSPLPCPISISGLDDYYSLHPAGDARDAAQPALLVAPAMAATPRTQSPSSPCEPHRTASLDLFSLSSATDRACSQTIRSPQRQHHRTASDSQHSFQPPWPKPSPTSTGHRDKSSIGSNYFKLMVEPSASSATAAATPFIDIDMSATTLARTAKASGNTTTAASGAESGSPVSAMQHRRPKWPPSTSHRRSSAATTPEHSTLDGHNILPAPMQQMDSPNSTQNGQAPLAEQEAAHNDEDGEYDSTSSIRHHTIDHNINDVAGSSDASPSSAGSIAEALSNSSSSAIESCKKPGSPKRMLPHDSTSETPSRSRRRSPGESHRPGHSLSTRKRSAESLRLVLPPGTSSQNVMPVTTLRAETLPEKLSVAEDGDAIVMVTPQHLVNLIDSAGEDILLLDVRISRQYALSTISGALNLCIPTTLLKRPSFNTQKVADSFKDSKQKAKFERWKSNSHIVVFDAHSSRLEEASICTSTLNKFRNQDWSGCLYVIRGGFDQFAHTFPTYITTDQHMAPAVTPSSLKLTTNVESKAPPVLGGCPMPANKNAANPFFGNIRQNMDLIGGVGQIPIRLPASISDGTAARLPTWLRSVLAGDDAGKIVAENFLQIERTEQKRMQHALSGEVCIGSPLPVSADRPQIAGIEKGGKNRYNNIWPYEHSRVKLEEVPNGGCDYVNANFVQASWSPKRYIATQGPVPSTFAVSTNTRRQKSLDLEDWPLTLFAW